MEAATARQREAVERQLNALPPRRVGHPERPRQGEEKEERQAPSKIVLSINGNVEALSSAKKNCLRLCPFFAVRR